MAGKKSQKCQVEGWNAWVDCAFAKGARLMHRHTRLKSQWTPTTTKAGGSVTADPIVVLQDQASTLHRFWNASSVAGVVDVPDRDSFDLSSPQEIRAASKSFPTSTSSSLDGLHPRHYAMLCDAALWCLAYIIMAMESVGFPPEHVFWLLFPLLEKPSGGYRPILLSPSLIRLWERLRQPTLQSFRERSGRKY